LPAERNTLKTCILTDFQRFLVLVGVRARPCSPHLGISWAQLWHHMPIYAC
jgi:hypothetical protein